MSTDYFQIIRIWSKVISNKLTHIYQILSTGCYGYIGLHRSEEKHTDSLAIMLRKGGECLTWHVTVTDTLADTYLCEYNSRQCRWRYRLKKRQLFCNRTVSFFVLLAIETLGPIKFKGLNFFSDCGERLTAATVDPREALYLFQCISILMNIFISI